MKYLVGFAVLSLLLIAAASTSQEGDQVSFGSDINIAESQTVPRDAVCMFCSIRDNGTVGRDLVAVFGSATVNGPVGRDATAVFGDVHLGGKAAVERDAVAVGGNLSKDAGATVGRDSTSMGFLPVHFGLSFSPFWAAGGLILVSLLLLILFPTQLGTTMVLIENRPFASFGLGCLGTLAGSFLMIFLAITVILIPVALAVGLVMAAAWAFGWAALALLVGRRLLDRANQQPNPLLAVVAGGVLLGLISVVPVLGFLVALVAGSVALGAAGGSRFGTRRSQTDFFRLREPPAEQT